jgi:hypothetical protein
VYSIRTVRTGSGASAVQIVRYERRKRIVVKHIGSAHDSEELFSLKQIAHEWIEQESGQPPLFPRDNTRSLRLVPIDKCRYLGFRYALVYEVVHEVFRRLHLDGLDLFLRDLALIRVVQPASKLESLDLLSSYFGKSYRRADLYRSLPSFVALKGPIEKSLGAWARTQFNFDFSIVFYDVTTLYFESFKEDELRRNGFSKDHKANQPQIIIGLIVTREGFPVSYHVFEGNRFEGHTFIPALRQFKETHHVDHFTVVADAAMISLDNISRLTENKLSYIVGARLANLSAEQIRAIHEPLQQMDGATIRIETERGFLICDFSLRRYQKDLREMEKQIAKAEKLLTARQAVKRTKFIKYDGQTKPTLNRELIEKTKMILGIKGYYTNLAAVGNQTIIDQYHNLWHVEQAFRIAKSDLAIRPIYQFKKQAIEVHIIICFIALAVCKYLELKTGKSIRLIIKMLKSVTDARLHNLLTDKEIILRSEPTPEVQKLLRALSH